MKKIIALILALTMAASLCACGNVVKEGGSTVPKETSAPTDPVGETQNTEAITEPVANEYVFTYQGTDIVMNAPAEDVIAALGEPKSYTEETSCAFDGLDKTYFYGSFYLQTYPLEGKDYIYCLWIVDDSVTTPEGIYIGAAQAQVEEAYGTDGYNGSNAYIMTGKNARLTIIMDNGVVSSIQYDAIV